MPELPEVETIRQGLQKYLVGHRIENAEVKLKRIFSGDPKDIIGAKITQIKRFGKGLVINLNNKYSIAIHIKLTGQLIYQGPDIPKNSRISKEKVGTLPNKFTHVIFHLDKNSFLYYNDIRQFGWIKIVENSKLKDQSFFKDLGPEFPLIKSTDNLTMEQFMSILSKSKLAVKPLIMDQKKIAGIGNIYANDGLYLAKINPRKPANSLREEEAKRLYAALLTVLEKGLKEGGASELTFVNVLGQKGNYQNHTLIYGKDGQSCKNCGGKIQRIVVGGRGTFFCPACQK